MIFVALKFSFFEVLVTELWKSYSYFSLVIFKKLDVLSAGVNVYRDNLISFAWVEFILEFAIDIPKFYFFFYLIFILS